MTEVKGLSTLLRGGIPTREAFTALCQDKAKCEDLGMNDGTRRGYLSYLKDNRHISIDKMEEWLLKSGKVVVQEKLWK